MTSFYKSTDGGDTEYISQIDDYVLRAEQAAIASEDSAQDALGHANDASAQAGVAGDYANDAMGYANDALGYSQDALGHAQDALGHANDAEQSSQDSLLYAQASEADRLLAEQAAQDALSYLNLMTPPITEWTPVALGSSIDPTSYPVDPEGRFFEIVGPTIGDYSAGDIVWFDNAGTFKGKIGSIDELVAGNGINIDVTNPSRPVITATGGGSGGQVDSVVGGSGISVDATDPENPIITNTLDLAPYALTSALGTMSSENASDYLTELQSDAKYAVPGDIPTPVDYSAKLDSVVGGSGISVDITDPQNPVITASGGPSGGQVDSVVGGSGISVDNTDPENPIITNTLDLAPYALTSALGTMSSENASDYQTTLQSDAKYAVPGDIPTPIDYSAKLDSVVAGNGITIDNTDPQNPVITGYEGFIEKVVYNLTSLAPETINLTDAEANKLIVVNSTAALVTKFISFVNVSPNFSCYVFRTSGGGPKTLNGATFHIPCKGIIGASTYNLPVGKMVRVIRDVTDGTFRIHADIEEPKVLQVVGGTGISVDNTDPEKPIITASGGPSGGQVDSVVGGNGIAIDNTDPENPIIAFDNHIKVKEITGTTYTLTTADIGMVLSCTASSDVLITIPSGLQDKTFNCIISNDVTYKNVSVSGSFNNNSGAYLIQAGESASILPTLVTNTYKIFGASFDYIQFQMKEVTSATYTVLKSDIGTIVSFTGSADVVVTVPEGLGDKAFNCVLSNELTGKKITVVKASGSTVVIFNIAATYEIPEGGSASLIPTLTANKYRLIGKTV